MIRCIHYRKGMVKLITRGIDNLLESVSGPSIDKALTELSSKESFSPTQNEKKEVNLTITESDFSSVVDKDEYINSIFIFKIPLIKKYIRATYNPGDRNTPDYERYFAFKLDLYLMSWVCVSYLIKSIDQGNISNAYVTGMKEDLRFVGKQYNWLQSYFTIGYAVMIIPSQIIITWVRPNLWLPACEIIWGVLTLLAGGKFITAAPQLYPIRFLIGLFESSSWPGIMVVLMHWYGPSELASRAAGFGAAGIAGNMFTGFMQAAITKTLDGAHGYEGWRWLFIINGIMTIVVAIAGFILLPGIPEEGRSAIWLTDDDVKIALRRAQKFKKKSAGKFVWRDIPRLLLDYKVWVFLLSYTTWTWSRFGLSYFNLWLKSLKNAEGAARFSSYQLNLIPVGGYAISFIMVLASSKLADLYNHHRFLIAIATEFFAVFATSVLTGWPSSTAFKFFAFFLLYTIDGVGPILTSLLTDIYRKDPVIRSVTLGLVVAVVYGMNAWYPLYIWPVTDSPTFKIGWPVSLAFSLVSITMMSSFFFIHKRTVIKLANDDYRGNDLIDEA